ncbi:MAG TPA: arsenate reductase ArsC [Alphaproteobacteria bacterium]|nr:arsenate reductase ArsC [Alphaproteobacteria bacterium]
MGGLPSSVLFACTRNSIRSPMAEALLRHLWRQRIFVQSVGVRAGDLDPFAVAVMDEIGISIEGHLPQSFEDLHDSSFDLIVSLSPEAQHSAVELTRTMACEVEYWPTLEPSIVEGNRETRLDAYRAVRDQLMKRIETRFPPPLRPEV